MLALVETAPEADAHTIEQSAKFISKAGDSANSTLEWQRNFVNSCHSGHYIFLEVEGIWFTATCASGNRTRYTQPPNRVNPIARVATFV